MPIAPKRPCAQPGCPALVAKGRCAKHAQQTSRAYEQARGTSSARGYDSAWRKASDAYLAKYPWCAAHMKQGHFAPATHVDHIIAHKGDKALFWDSSNWQSLCHSCHSSKTAAQDGGFGNARQHHG